MCSRVFFRYVILSLYMYKCIVVINKYNSYLLGYNLLNILTASCKIANLNLIL